MEYKVDHLRLRGFAAALILGTLASLSSPLSAGASPGSRAVDTPDLTTQEVTDAVAAADPASPPAEVIDEVEGGFAATRGDLSLVVPSGPGDPITVEGTTSTVGLTPRIDTEHGTDDRGGVVFPSGDDDTSVVVRALESGGVQILSVLESESAPSTQYFDLDLPAGSDLVRNANGSVSVLSGGVEIGIFDAPWATDALGRSLETNYSIEGSTLVQETDVTGAAYPVVADPAYYADCGLVTCTRWVSVASTRNLYLNRFNSTSSAWQLIHGAKCAISLLGGPLVGTGCAVFTAWLIHDMTANLEYAGQNKRCIVVKYSRQLGFAFPTDYSNTSPANTKKCHRS